MGSFPVPHLPRALAYRAGRGVGDAIMCGIAGELKLRRTAGVEDPEAWRDLMRRRGPDDAGLWRETSETAEITLVFRRLSIIDPSPAGHQPMLDPSGRYALVWNGELFNFRELRRELESEEVVFRSRTDTEVALQALARWGPLALDRFDGMFALALWDRRTRQLLLARDLVGIKPLYWAHGDDGVVFASQYEPLLVHPWLRRRSIDPEALGLYLRLGFIPAPWAVLEGTEMLEAGAWVRVSADGTVERDRHGPAKLSAAGFGEGGSERGWSRHEEITEAVSAAVAESVRRQLVSDVPLGTFLSGGVDSPLVTAEAIRLRSDIPTFTLGLAGDGLDERPAAAAYARQIGVEPVVGLADETVAADELMRSVEAFGEPFADPSLLPTLQLSRLAARQVKVALSGDGGDELFWGYDWRQPGFLRAAPDFARPQLWRDLRWWARRFLGLGSGYPHLRFPTLGHWYRERHAKLKEPQLERIFRHPPAWPEAADFFTFDGSDRESTGRWMRQNEMGWHLQMILLKVDRASMHHSLEVRVPLLGRPVLDVASDLAWSDCVDLEGRRGKLPLRRALALRLKSSGDEKKGFAPAIGRWLAGPLRALVEDELVAADDLAGLPLHKDGVRRYAELVTRQSAAGPGLLLLLTLKLWERRRARLVAEFDADLSSSFNTERAGA